MLRFISRMSALWLSSVLASSAIAQDFSIPGTSPLDLNVISNAGLSADISNQSLSGVTGTQPGEDLRQLVLTENGFQPLS
jgi:hypothetical protein